MPSPEDRFASSDPDDLAQRLALELERERAVWQRQRSQRGKWRALSLAFLFLVLLGALFAFFVFLPQWRSHSRANPAATEAAGDR